LSELIKRIGQENFTLFILENQSFVSAPGFGLPAPELLERMDFGMSFRICREYPDLDSII